MSLDDIRGDPEVRSALPYSGRVRKGTGLRSAVYEAIARAVATNGCAHAHLASPPKLYVFLVCDVASCSKCLPQFADVMNAAKQAVQSGTDTKCDLCREQRDAFRPVMIEVGPALIAADICDECWGLR